MQLLFIVLGVVGVIAAAWFFLRRRARNSQPPIVSLVFLMSQPRELSEERVREVVEEIFNLKLGYEMRPDTNWLVEGGKVNASLAQPNARNYLVSANDRMFLVNSVSKPYMDEPEKFAETIADLRLRRAVGSHVAWNSVDHFGDPPNDAERGEVYTLLGKMLAEFAGDDCLAIYCPELGRCNEYAPEVLEKLRAGQPLDMFEEPTFAPIVQVSKDDPRMIAAVAEARRRWPEFAAAFQARETANEAFIVKARFADGENEEFMWVQVQKLEGNSIIGELGNSPAALTNVKEGDIVTVPLEDLNDWLCQINGEAVGGFTMKVMKEAMKN
jgi:uncharacterized protein YegJ (DUF2314 family)